MAQVDASQRGTASEHDASRAAAGTAHELDGVSDEVIDVPTVARLLAVGRNTVYALVARDAIPHRRLGKQIRFHRAAVMRWLASWSLQGAKERQ
jgi:excisionase family DNA binding protein